MVTAAEHTSWQEEHVRGERGREVRYYLMRRDGAADLAVVGRERGMRHMVYQVVIRGRDVISLSPTGKLRTRREVVDWLDSMVSGFSGNSSQIRPLVKDACKLDTEILKDNQPRKPSHVAESVWVGTPWTCRKRRMHYPAFLRNGVKISVNDFVFVLAEENKRLVAHLDDLYEDSRGNKMVVVQWFHKIDEVGFVLPHNFNDKEIFFSHCLQDLSIECIDGLATVLSPQHFEKHLSHAQLAQLELFVCQSLFDNDEIKPFDVTQIKGYWKQAILKQNTGTAAPLKAHVKSFPLEGVVARPKKRLRHSIEPEQYVNTNLVVPKVETGVSKPNVSDACLSLKLEKEQQPGQHLNVGSQIEVLSQDSGIRGCWFRAVIIKKHKDKVKVQYTDVKDAENEANNLQEWLPALKFALHDPLGLRLSGRTTIRPNPTSEKEKLSLLLCPGTIVDVWWYDGWWEGILLQKEKEDKICVYFPGEKQTSTFAYGDLRLSKEWVGSRWVSIKDRPDLVASIQSGLNEQVSETRISKHDKSMIDDGKRLVSAAHKERSVVDEDVRKKPHVATVHNKMKDMYSGHDLSKDDFFDRLKWKQLKRRTPCIINKRKNSPNNKATRVYDLFIRGSLKVDRDNCKYMGDCTFSPSVPSLTSLVMSR